MKVLSVVTTVINLKLLEMTPASWHSWGPTADSYRRCFSLLFCCPPPRSFSSSAVPISASWPVLDAGSLAFPPLPCPSLQFSQFGLFLLCRSPTSTFSAHCPLDHQAPLLSFSLLLSQALDYLVWQNHSLCPDSVALPAYGLCRAASRLELTARQPFSLSLGLENLADIKDLPFAEYSVFLWPFSRFIRPN